MDKDNKKNIAKSEEYMEQVLVHIEKTVDEKLKNIKTFTPILITIITSVIAFLLPMKVDMSQDSTNVLLFALGVLLVSFIIIVVSFFGRTHYKAIIKTTNKVFVPHQFDSYCYLSDTMFLDNLKEYAQRDLTEKESLTANFVKQRINECIFRRNCINVALSAVETGSLILAISCFVFPFIQ